MSTLNKILTIISGVLKILFGDPLDKNKKNLTISYLIGLITGRGHLFRKSKTITIEFSHNKEISVGIFHCAKCGQLVTKNAKTKVYTCKNSSCQKTYENSGAKEYNAVASTRLSLNEVIIPLLKSEISANFIVSGNNATTLLILDFKDNPQLFEEITSCFEGKFSFDSFDIPKKIHEASYDEKIEFINGVLDTAGFSSPGGWLNRDGVSGHGRMRAYFQIVRNWSITVQIDNFLRKYFNLPVQTIDWGHPNIRDGNLVDFFEGKKTGSTREHQIKFFPEYYTIFKFRIKYKADMLSELAKHNSSCVFENKEDWFPPGGVSRVKSFHPDEADIRIPQQARQHVNAFWQVNYLMGCEYLEQLANTAKSKDLFFLTGNLTKLGDDFEKLKKEYEKTSNNLYNELSVQNAKKSSTKKLKITKADELRFLEKDTYPILTREIKSYLETKYGEPVEAFDTSSFNLNAFLKNQSLIEAYDHCEKFNIKVDIFAFLVKTKRIVFVESKITNLDVKALGQMIGYCLVGQPIEAILVSTESPTASFINLLTANPKILNYGNDLKIQIATLKNKQIRFEKI